MDIIWSLLLIKHPIFDQSLTTFLTKKHTSLRQPLTTGWWWRGTQISRKRLMVHCPAVKSPLYLTKICYVVICIMCFGVGMSTFFLKKNKNKKSRKTKKHTKTTCVTTRTQPCAQNVDTVVGLILHTIRRAPCNHFTRQYFVASYSSCTQSHLWTLKRQTMWLAIASCWDALASRSNAWNCPWCWSPCSRAREVFGHIE